MNRKKTDWATWLHDTVEQREQDCTGSFGAGYQNIADIVLRNAQPQAGDRVLDVGTGTGLLAFHAAGLVGNEGQVIGVDADAQCIRRCLECLEQRPMQNVGFLEGDAFALPVPDMDVDVVVCRSVLCHIPDKTAALREWFRVLKTTGRFSLYEPLDRYETLFSDLIDFSPLGKLATRLRNAEEAVHRNPNDSLMNFDERELLDMFTGVGFHDVEYRLVERSRKYAMTASTARNWWRLDIGGAPLPGHPSPCELLNEHMSAPELDRCVEYFCSQIDGKEMVFRSKQVYMWGRK